MATPLSFNALLVTGQVSPVPQKGDYYHFTFRLISATTVSRRSWRSTTFSEPILKASIPLLEGAQARLDHNMWDVNDCIGNIVNVRWENSFVDKNGNTVPGGLLGEYQIDGRLYPDLVRKLTGVPDEGIMPIKLGSSVTVEFEFEPSHSFEDEWDFERNLGKVIDGKEVTRNVTKILRYYESSLVGAGADPYALQRFSGLLPTADFQKEMNRMSFSFGKEPLEIQAAYEQQKILVLDMDNVGGANPSQGTADTERLEKDVLKLREEKQTLQAQFAALQGRFDNLQKEHVKSTEQAAQLGTQVTTLTQQLQQAETHAQELALRAEIGDAYMLTKRADTIRYSRLALDANTAQAMEKTIQDANYETLEAFHTQYKALAEQKHPLACPECGGSVSRQSSTQTNPDNSQGGEDYMGLLARNFANR